MNRASFLAALAAVPFVGPLLRKRPRLEDIVFKPRSLGWSTIVYGSFPTEFPFEKLSDLDKLGPGARFAAWNTSAKHSNGPTFADADEPVIRDVSGFIQTHTRPFTPLEKQYLKHRWQGYGWTA